MNAGTTGAPVWTDINARPGVVEADFPKKSTNTPWLAGRFWSNMKPTSPFCLSARTQARYALWAGSTFRPARRRKPSHSWLTTGFLRIFVMMVTG